MSEIKKASLEAVRATGEKFSKGQDVSKNDKDAVMAFIDADMRQGEADASASAGHEFQRIRNGDPSANIPCTNIGIDTFVKERYGFDSLPTFLNAKFGLDPRVHSLQAHVDAISGTGQQVMKLSGAMAGDFNNSYRWLVQEVIMRYVIRGMQSPATSVDNLISGTDNVMNDEFKIPAVLAGDTRPDRMEEGQTIKLATLRFGEKTVKTRPFGKGLGISDWQMKKVSLDVFSIFLQQLGRDIMIAESIEALQVLLNGEQASESAAEIGITTSGTLKDKDVWRALHKLEELGYKPDYVIGNTETILSVNELPMFRGYDGAKQEGKLNNEGLSFTTPNLRTVSRSDMTNGKLLFGSRQALRKAVYLPYRIEQAREASTLESFIYVSGSSGFYIANSDARILVDPASTIVAKPFPASMDLYAANGFK